MADIDVGRFEVKSATFKDIEKTDDTKEVYEYGMETETGKKVKLTNPRALDLKVGWFYDIVIKNPQSSLTEFDEPMEPEAGEALVDETEEEKSRD